MIIPDVTYTRAPLNDTAITDTAGQRGIDVPALSRYRLQAQAARGFIFGFGNMSPEPLPPAVRRFADIVAAT